MRKSGVKFMVSEYISPKHYAERWDLSYATVMRAILDGRLKANKIGRLYRVQKDEAIQCANYEVVGSDFEMALDNLK